MERKSKKKEDCKKCARTRKEGKRRKISEMPVKARVKCRKTLRERYRQIYREKMPFSYKRSM